MKSEPKSSRNKKYPLLSKLRLRLRKKKAKTLLDFYGKLPNAFGDGVAYQKKSEMSGNKLLVDIPRVVEFPNE